MSHCPQKNIGLLVRIGVWGGFPPPIPYPRLPSFKELLKATRKRKTIKKKKRKNGGWAETVSSHPESSKANNELWGATHTLHKRKKKKPKHSSYTFEKFKSMYRKSPCIYLFTCTCDIGIHTVRKVCKFKCEQGERLSGELEWLRDAGALCHRSPGNGGRTSCCSGVLHQVVDATRLDKRFLS